MSVMTPLFLLQFADGQFTMSFTHTFPDIKNATSYFAFCYPFSYDECQVKLEKLDSQYSHCKKIADAASCPDDIYYYRELLCHSLDGLRVDLITVTSCLGLQNEREEYLGNLFPERNVPRAHKFNKKKVSQPLRKILTFHNFIHFIF